ncbi:MAG: transcription elongation factor NusA [Sulfolobales archaeon]
MKIPLDYICVKTGVLCPRCRRLVEIGMVEEFEIDLMRAMIDVENDAEFKNILSDFTYVKAYRFSDNIVIVGEFSHKADQRILQRLSKVLSDKLNMRVRVISPSNKKDVKSLISQLIFPARILGVNIVWVPDGSQQHIVRIPRTDLRYITLPIENIEKIVEVISGESVKIRIE